MPTVAGLFERYEDANQVLHALNEMGYDSGDISVVAPKNAIPERLAESPGYQKTVQKDTAATGAIFGGLAGLLLGVGVLFLPGIGPILSAGAIGTILGSAAAGAGIGAATGSLRGALSEMGIPDAEATVYEEAVGKGGILLTVIDEGPRIQEIRNLFKRYHAIDMDTRQSKTARNLADENRMRSKKDEEP
jgi:Heat induced stress protein YflT